MCGITAIVDSTGERIADKLGVATDLLRHRGPDGTDVWVGDSGSVGLGHARLSVIDVEHGRQPLSNEDGTIRATVNGEFYGAEEIREQLELQGHRFKTLSDSEILLHLYEELGTACLRQLRGEFAFALWDATRSRLWAVRDRFGIKPLFYHACGGRLALASEAKSLFAIGVPAAWDTSGVLEQLFFFVRQDRTLFRDIRQLAPGHFLLHEDGRTTIHRYWDLDYPANGSNGGRSEAERGELFREGLRTAVRVRLRSDAPVTVFLSGGLDSSCVLALAAEHGTPPPAALHVSFVGTDYDESAMARGAAAFVGAHLDILEVNERHLVDNFADAVWHGEMLAFNAHAVARYLQSRAARDHGYKVALTGEGADETVGGYPGFKQDAMPDDAGRRLRPHAALRVLTGRLGFSPTWIERVHAERAPFYALLNPSFLGTFRFDDVCEAFVDQFDVESQLRGRHPLQQSMYLWMKSVLPNYTLCADRLDMAHGIETRQPFLDHHLWEITRAVPHDQLIRGYDEKRILRDASVGWIPELIRSRSKHSFTAPTISSGGPLREFANDELRSVGFRSVPFFDHEAVVSMLDLLEDTPVPGVDSAVMMLLCAHLLNKTYHLS